jgi:hypothetical protein
MTPDGVKAAEYFKKALVVASAGNYEDAIEMFLEGLSIVPDNVVAHAELRELSLKRKAVGGKPIGVLGQIRLRVALVTAFNPRRTMLATEKLLAYDPLNTNWMLALALKCKVAGYRATSEWIGGILCRAEN